MFEWRATPEAWIMLRDVTALEIVLGIANIIFILAAVFLPYGWITSLNGTL